MEIERNELISEMRVALQDEFVAEVTEYENGLLLTFADDRKFLVEIRQM